MNPNPTSIPTLVSRAIDELLLDLSHQQQQ
jgi:hypothetical protein